MTTGGGARGDRGSETLCCWPRGWREGPRAEECRRVLRAGNGVSPSAPRRSPAPSHLRLGRLSLGTMQRQTRVVVIHQAGGDLLQQPRETRVR